MSPKKQKELTFGQRKAGVQHENSRINNNDKIIRARLLFAQIFDILNDDLVDDRNDERNRLDNIAMDEVNGALENVERALTYNRESLESKS